MASRTTFGKMQRERKKKAKAAAKRARRQERNDTPDEDVESPEAADPGMELTPDELLRQVQQLQERLERGEITLEESEEEKAALAERLAQIID